MQQLLALTACPDWTEILPENVDDLANTIAGMQAWLSLLVLPWEGDFLTQVSPLVASGEGIAAILLSLFFAAVGALLSSSPATPCMCHNNVECNNEAESPLSIVSQETCNSVFCKMCICQGIVKTYYLSCISFTTVSQKHNQE